jgi:hypothetical protein
MTHDRWASAATIFGTTLAAFQHLGYRVDGLAMLVLLYVVLAWCSPKQT